MAAVTLARIHGMMRNNADAINDLSASSMSQGMSYNFMILEDTTAGDLDYFQKRIASRKAAILRDYEEIKKRLEYGEYLKKELAKANVKYGIADKLLHASWLRRRLDKLNEINEYIKANADSQFSPVKDVNYYKSAFTENNRTFNLTLYAFESSDLNRSVMEINALKKEMRDVDDEIASLNQSSTHELMSFEEFTGK